MPEIEQGTAFDAAARRRVGAVVQTLARIGGDGHSLAELAHDARNMVTALTLYCDLLEEPDVLSAPFRHYGGELRLVAAASRRLVEKMVALDTIDFPGDLPLPKPSLAANSPQGSLRRAERAGPVSPLPAGAGGKDRGPAPGEDLNPGFGFRQDAGLLGSSQWDMLPPRPIDNLAHELLANRNLLAALSGVAIVLTVDAEGGAHPVRLNAEDLTRILVNLVKNASEAMAAGGRIHLHLRERAGPSGSGPLLVLSVEDSGPGIPRNLLATVFEPGFSTRTDHAPGASGWPASHRGLGLSITRSLVETAGGRIHAVNRPSGGACIAIELPVRTP